jgi:hypothetical protein
MCMLCVGIHIICGGMYMYMYMRVYMCIYICPVHNLFADSVHARLRIANVCGYACLGCVYVVCVIIVIIIIIIVIIVLIS